MSPYAYYHQTDISKDRLVPSANNHFPELLIPMYESPSVFFFFNDTATTEIYPLSLHDALPIFGSLTRRSSASSTIEDLKHGSAPRGSSVSGRPFSSSVPPLACSAHTASTLAGSAALNAGTPIIKLVDRRGSSSSCRRRSLTML